MAAESRTDAWHVVARETFERTMLPWIGRGHESWLRAWVREHPVDPRGQVLVPERIFRVFNERVPFEPASRAQLAAMGYPELPAERDGDGQRTARGSAAGAPAGAGSA